MQSEAAQKQTSLTQDERTSFRLWLQRQFTDRCKKNPRYSLRAFARSLSLDASSLSQILAGKRPLSKASVEKICSKLNASPKELKRFGLLQVQSPDDHAFEQVAADTFAVISDWYHYAILELTFVSGFKAEPQWVARKLSITTQEAKSAIERLLRLGLLMEENGSLVKSSKLLTNSSAVNTSAAHRELQKQLIQKALLSVDECAAEEKDITSMTMAIDISHMGKARELIKKFRRDLCALLEDGEQSRVYNLGIQLYPVSNIEENP